MAAAAVISTIVVNVGACAVPVVNAVMMAATFDDDGMSVGVRGRCRDEDRGDRRDH